MTNRYVCNAIGEMRELIATLSNLAKDSQGINSQIDNMFLINRLKYLSVHLEELQVYVNRMESGLEDKWSLHEYQKKVSKYKKEFRSLKEDIKILEERKEQLTLEKAKRDLEEVCKEVATQRTKLREMKMRENNLKRGTSGD